MKAEEKRVGPIERELARRAFFARSKMGEAKRNGDELQYQYWKAQNDSYTSASRLAEKYGA